MLRTEKYPTKNPARWSLDKAGEESSFLIWLLGKLLSRLENQVEPLPSVQSWKYFSCNSGGAEFNLIYVIAMETYIDIYIYI